MEERELLEKGAGLRGLSAGTKTTNTALRCHKKDDRMTTMAREMTQKPWGGWGRDRRWDDNVTT
jgi:hypothetical protein